MSFSDATNWAVNEFAEADLGDLRRTQRLVQPELPTSTRESRFLMAYSHPY